MSFQLPVTKPNQRHTRAQWKQLVEAFRQSGLSSKQFCMEHEIGYASFCQWRKRLSAESDLSQQKHGEPNTPTAFLDLGALPHCGSADSPWHIVLKLGNGIELCLTPSHVSP